MLGHSVVFHIEERAVVRLFWDALVPLREQRPVRSSIADCPGELLPMNWIFWRM